MEGSENLPLDLPVEIRNLKNVTIDETSKQIYVGTSSGIYRKSITTGLPEENFPEINAFILEQNFPNPFNSETVITYYVPFNALIILKIYDLLGNELRVLVAEEKQKGIHKVRFNTERLSSGIYIYTLMSGTQRISKKMTLIK